MRFLILSIFLLLAIMSCKKDDVASKDDFLGFKQMDYFPAPTYNMQRNPVTKAGFELGKKLFYDPRISKDNSISCGSCHIQSAAFTHHGHDVSHGIEDRLGTRNAMPVMNMAWGKQFFWDGGVFDLDLVAINAITSHVEMDETVSNVISKLKSYPEYPALFKNAFGSEEINDASFLKALSLFMLMAVSDQSKYDQVKRGEAVFSDGELAGYQLFKTKCASCHTEPLMSNRSFANNGIQPSGLNDKGRFTVTLNPDDSYKFSVPSLRNLSFTGPYMHDGRFLTIDRVLEHYRSGMVDSETLDPIFRQSDGSIGIPMNDIEKQQLLQFLKTLDDYKFVTNPLLAEPIL
jgi:cytochrome c peroxidase